MVVNFLRFQTAKTGHCSNSFCQPSSRIRPYARNKLLHVEIDRQCLVLACAVKRRRFPVGANPTRQPLQPEATGAAMEVTKWLKPSDIMSRYTVTARVCRTKRE